MSDLYELPNRWEWKQLGEIAKFQSGGTPKRSEKSYWSGDIHWVKISDITDDMYVSNTEEFITKDGLDNSSAKLFPKNTILYTIFATIGKIGILDIEATTNQAISGIQPNDNVDLFYMYYGLKFITNEVQKVSAGVAQNNINLTKLKEQWFPLPPLSEQQRIVFKLDLVFEKIDKSIALQQKNMDEADVFMGSVLNDVFGELEDKYGKYKLDDLTSLITKGTTPTTNGYKFQSSGINFLKIENIVNGEIDLSTIEMFISEEAHQSQKRSQLEVNDVLFSIAGTIGDTAIVKKEHLPMNTNQAVALIRPIEKLNSEFLRRLLSSSISNDTTNKQRGGAIKNVSLGDIKETIIPVPPLQIQQKVVEYLDEISEKIEKVKSLQKEKMDSLKALKASILDKAFRGEL